MSMVSRGRCRTCHRRSDHGSHTRCLSRALSAERYGTQRELERERVRVPRPRAGAR